MFNIESASLSMSHCLIDYSFIDMFYFYLSASWNKCINTINTCFRVVQVLFHFFYFLGNVINIKISTTKLPLRHVPPILFSAIYVPLIEYHRGICSAQMVPISQSAHRLWVVCPKDADGILNSVDPDQTAPLGILVMRKAETVPKPEDLAFSGDRAEWSSEISRSRFMGVDLTGMCLPISICPKT